jgi:hypothetical protein
MAYDLRASKKVRPGYAAREVLGEQPYDLRAPKAVRPGYDKRLGPPPGKPQSSPAPSAQKAAAAAMSADNSQADLIANYNLARAKILQDMAPDVQGIYSQATKDLGGVVGGLTGDLRSRLFDAGGGNVNNPLADPVSTKRILDSYNPDSASNAAYALGAAIPGESLAKQGAAFGAAAAFAPERALTEGQYALQKAVNDAKVKNADAAKVSASTSKLLGYVADAFGNPIPGKNGKPVKLPDQNAITPYQEASLKLRAGQIDYGRYKDDRSYALQVDKAQKTNKRFYDGLIYRSAQAAETAKQKASVTDWTASGKAGVLIAKDGTVIHDKNGRTVKFTKPSTAAEKTKSVTQAAKLDDTARQMFEGTAAKTELRNVGKDENGNPIIKPVAKVAAKPGISYQVALRRLRSKASYGLSLDDAQEVLDNYYPRGEQGRPYFSYQERGKILKKWPKQKPLLEKAMRGNHDAAVQLSEFVNSHGGV